MLYKNISTKTTDAQKKIINNDAIGKTIEITQRGHSVIVCTRHFFISVFFAYILFMVNRTFNATPTENLLE